MIRYLIVDDEPIAHRIIESFTKDLPHLELSKNCYNAMEAMEFLMGNEVDLIFLDLNMPKIKGFDFLRTLANPPKVIITSAYAEFAMEGYELNVLDYLLKPFSFERFMKAVNKMRETKEEVQHSPNLQPKSQPSPKPERIFLKGDKKHHQVNLGDIQFIEATGNYTKVFTDKGMILTHEKISGYENLLAPDDFIRVHKSFIVQIARINIVEGNRILIGDHKIPIGLTYKHKVNRLFDN